MWKKIIEGLKSLGQVAWGLMAIGIICAIIYGVLENLGGKLFSRRTDNAVLPAGGSQASDSGRQMKLVYGRIRRDPLSKLDLFPVLYRSVEKDGEGRGLEFASGKFSSGYDGGDDFGMEYSNFNNLLFRNPASGAQHLLLEKPGFITKFVMLEHEKGAKAAQTLNFYFFAMAEADSNGDGLIDGDDEQGAYVAKRDGRAYWKISPKGFSYEDWYVEPDNDTVYLNLREDSNHDKKFGGEDAFRLFVAQAPDFKPGPAIDPALDKQLRQLMQARN